MTHFYSRKMTATIYQTICVNALSGWWLISTFRAAFNNSYRDIAVSMPSRADDSFLRGRKFRQYSPDQIRVNALSGWWLISTVPLQNPRFYAVSRAYFCRYLSEYSDRSSFSCMFTIWTYLTRQIFPNPEFTIAQNYSSVILFFHQNYRRTHSLILSLAPVRNILRQHLHPLHMDYNEVIAYGMLVDLWPHLISHSVQTVDQVLFCWNTWEVLLKFAIRLLLDHLTDSSISNWLLVELPLVYCKSAPNHSDDLQNTFWFRFFSHR